MIDFCSNCERNPCRCIVEPTEQYCMEVAPTKRIVKPSDVIDIEESDDTVYVIGTRGEKVTVISGLDNMINLTTLVLRSCLVSSMAGIENLMSLTKLELYDNQIEEIVGLEKLTNLTILDLSYNSIREMGAVNSCPYLQELYIAQNKLRKIEGLESARHLRILDLGANRIRVMEGLENLTSLKSLWLGKNKIEMISCVSTFTQLCQLDVQSNRLQGLGSALVSLHSLKELYLANNGIHSVAGGLPTQSSLHTLDLSSNPLDTLEGIGSQSHLQELWMTSTKLLTFDDIAPLVKLPSLTCVYLEHSPVAQHPEYVQYLISLIPTLEQLDANIITWQDGERKLR